MLADFDHDGALDLAVVNGRVNRNLAGGETTSGTFWSRYVERNQLFVNDGTGRPREVIDAFTLDRFDVTYAEWPSGLYGAQDRYHAILLHVPPFSSSLAQVVRVAWSKPLVRELPLLSYRPQEFASAAVGAGKVYIGSSARVFYGLRQRDGAVLWEGSALDVLEERTDTVLPSALLDAIVGAIGSAELPELLARLFGEGTADADRGRP